MNEVPVPSWYRPRGYRHFDPIVDCRAAVRFVSDPESVIRHPFLPLLSYTKSTPRYDRSKRKVVSKDRPISYASHMDSQIFAYYGKLLTGPYEAELKRLYLSDCVIAYRSINRKCNIEFAAEVFTAIEAAGNCVALGLDVTGFFDHISHAALKANWATLLGEKYLPLDHYKVFKALTNYAYVCRDEVYSALGITRSADEDARLPLCTPEQLGTSIRGRGLIRVNNKSYGIPQGTPISAIASNISMLEFDKSAVNLAIDVGGVYRRYSDDIFFLSPPNRVTEVETLLNSFLAPLGLEFKSSKTERVEFESTNSGVRIRTGKPFPYLGFVFDGRRRLVRSSSLSRHWRRTKSRIRIAKKVAARAGHSGASAKIFRRSIYQKTTHFGQRRTFLRYVYRADRIMPGGAIRRQVRSHMKKVTSLLNE